MKKLIRQYIPESIINFYHKLQAIVANIWYGFPGKKMTVIGVTGTNGKTTVCYMISQVLDEAGLTNAMATTIFFKSGKKYIRNNSKMTTLNPFVLQRFLREAYNKGIRYAIVETTSHAIVQSRIWGIRYDSLVFTNITHDHLDYHQTFGNYLEAKLKLFRDNPQAKAVIYADDSQSGKFKSVVGNKVVTYSLEGKGDVNGRKIRSYDDGSIFNITWFGNEIETKLHVMGRFNIANALAAFCVAGNYNISPKTIAKALSDIQSIPGRLEYLDFGQSYKIVIDFAHTPDGLQKVFEAVKPVVHGRIIHVAGATGERDKTKRPILGALAGKYADIAIVTDEDPGVENPEDIINAVAEGVVRGAGKSDPKILGKNFYKILQRDKAIELALSLARKGDMVLITGKGHEEVMKVGEKLVPYSDKKVIGELLKKKDVIEVSKKIIGKKKKGYHDPNSFFILMPGERKQIQRIQEKAERLYLVELVSEDFIRKNPLVELRIISTIDQKEYTASGLYALGYWSFFGQYWPKKKSARIAALIYLYKKYNPTCSEDAIAKKIAQIIFR